METKICTMCKKELPIESFSWSEKKKNKRRSRCKECRSKYEMNVRKAKQKIIDEIKIQFGCQKCGDKRSYVFHLDPSIKENSIATMLNSNKIDDVLKEVEKCVVLCANCHREFHYLNAQSNLAIEDYLKYSENSEKSIDKWN